MRRKLVRILGPAVALVVTAACQMNKGAAPPQSPVVTITLTCTATDVTVKVGPTPRFKGGNGSGGVDVSWTVDSASHADDITITPEVGGQWPFEGSGPFHAKKGQPGHGKGKGAQTPGIYHYSVQGTCKNGLTVTVDPDIVVD